MNLLIRISLIFNLVCANEIYQSIRVFQSSDQDIEIIANFGIPLDHLSGKQGIYIDLVATEEQVSYLLIEGLDVEILVPNLTEYYKSRNIPELNREFPLGSMQGNYTWDELNARFDVLQEQFSDIISERVIIGESEEGRDIWAFKISDNPNEDEDEPELLLTSLIHAREPLSMMNLFYFVQLIGEDYESDSELNFLVNNREIWFIPVINPDGYVYNESIEPNGGGMHRKNRKDTGCGNGTSRGIDLNRNYGFGWGSDDFGSSPDPCSAVYRGESAFSEQETQVVRDFILSKDFKIVLHYHSYWNTYIHPFGDGSLPEEPALTTFQEIGNEMALFNGFSVGTGLATIGYTVNGDAVDWTYGDQDIIAYVPEVGSQAQGFWPSENEIISLCESQVHPNKTVAFVAGSDLILHSHEVSQEQITPGDQFNIEIIIQNRGLTNSEGDAIVNIESLNSFTLIDMDSYVFGEIDARDSDSFSISTSILGSAPNGVYSGLIISIENENSFPRQDTIKYIIGSPEVFFYDGFENGLDNWTLDDEWGLTENAANGQYALSDSPEGDYGDAQTTSAELSYDIDLSLISIPSISFKAKWDIEPSYDFVRIQANVINEGWISLEGNYTSIGTGQPAQPFGEPGYDDIQQNWVEETIFLDQLNNAQIIGFRFIQTSDNFVEGDGFSFDDFSISGFPNGTMGDFNLDTEIDIFDLLGIADAIIFGDEPSNSQLLLCDLDGSGVLNIMDLILLTNIIMSF